MSTFGYRMQLEKSSMKIKPLSTSAKEAVAALRAKVQAELQNKKQCSYQPYECTQLTLDSYNYCLRHILEDKSAPFKQCSYVYNSNSKRCYLPAPIGDKKEAAYCNEHALKAHLAKARQGTRFQPPHTAEYLLHSLSHYVKRPRSRTVSSSTQYSDEGRTTPDENEPKVTKSLDPFVDIDSYAINASGSDILDMCSESESDIEPSTYSNVWNDAQAESSDNESIDSEQEDVLKHANVYSAEEITLVTRDKLIRLQSLYIDQYRHLQYILRERKRRYLHSIKREKETCCSIYKQVRDNPKDQRLYGKLKAYNSYHKSHGEAAVLEKLLRERRMKITEGIMPKAQSHHGKCHYTEGGVKCGEKPIPLARHCRKHILEDTNQVLFRACGTVRGDVECTTPVEVIFDDDVCRLHCDVPPLRNYSQPRKDSESDYDDSGEGMSLVPLQQTSNVKTEYICYAKGPKRYDSSWSKAPNTYKPPNSIRQKLSQIINQAVKHELKFNEHNYQDQQHDLHMQVDNSSSSNSNIIPEIKMEVPESTTVLDYPTTNPNIDKDISKNMEIDENESHSVAPVEHICSEMGAAQMQSMSDSAEKQVIKTEELTMVPQIADKEESMEKAEAVSEVVPENLS